MNKLVTYFELAEDELSEVLYKTNSFISGGSALNVFLNKDFEVDQDLDIFLRIPDLTHNYLQDINNYPFAFESLAYGILDSYFKNNGYFPQKDADEKIKKYLKSVNNQNTNEIEYHQSALRYFIKNIKNYKKGNKKIQLIILFNCELNEFVDTFDFNICKLIIKGEKNFNSQNSPSFQYKLNFDNSHLSENDLNIIKNGKMFIDYCLYPYNLFDRIKKYTNRGFQLIDKQTGYSIFYLDDIELKKYINSNFNRIITYENLMTKRREELFNSLKESKMYNINGKDICKVISQFTY